MTIDPKRLSLLVPQDDIARWGTERVYRMAGTTFTKEEVDVIEINYKAVYRLRPLQAAIYSAEQKVRDAQKAVGDASAKFLAECAKEAGVDVTELEAESGSACMADGIGRHVYVIKDKAKMGSPQNKCLFCGCDNFDY